MNNLISQIVNEGGKLPKTQPNITPFASSPVAQALRSGIIEVPPPTNYRGEAVAISIKGNTFIGGTYEEAIGRMVLAMCGDGEVLSVTLAQQ